MEYVDLVFKDQEGKKISVSESLMEEDLLRFIDFLKKYDVKMKVFRMLDFFYDIDGEELQMYMRIPEEKYQAMSKLVEEKNISMEEAYDIIRQKDNSESWF